MLRNFQKHAGCKPDIQGLMSDFISSEHKKELEKTNERFISILNHDLKTPTLSQVRALKMLLQGRLGELNKSQQEIIHLTLNSCEQMLEMIDYIIYSDKFENNKIELNYEKIKLEEFLNNSCRDLEPQIRLKNLSVSVRFQSEVDFIDGDKKFLYIAIKNILENSISYSLNDTKLTLTVENSGKFAKFKIYSYGIFKTKDELEKMFEKYEKTSSYNKLGTCIKLSLAEQIIESHRGRISVTCEKLPPKTKNLAQTVTEITIPKLSPILYLHKL